MKNSQPQFLREMTSNIEKNQYYEIFYHIRSIRIPNLKKRMKFKIFRNYYFASSKKTTDWQLDEKTKECRRMKYESNDRGLSTKIALHGISAPSRFYRMEEKHWFLKKITSQVENFTLRP